MNRIYIFINLIIIIFLNKTLAFDSQEYLIKTSSKRLPTILTKAEADFMLKYRFGLDQKRTKVTNQTLSFYTTYDDYGFRNPINPKNFKSKKHLIIAGCSFTFGSGVKDEESLAYLIDNMQSDYRSYNFGSMGGSPSEQLFLLQFFNLSPLVENSEGFYLYNLYHAQFERIAMYWNYLYWASKGTPYYSWKKESHQLKFKSFFDSLFSFKIINFFKLIKLDYPYLKIMANFDYLTSQDMMPLMIDYLKAIKVEYLRQFPKGRFILTRPIFEAWLPPVLKGREKDFFDLLKANNIEVWDFNSKAAIFLNQRPYDEWIIKNDGHPNGLQYKAQAEFIVKKLKAITQ